MRATARKRSKLTMRSRSSRISWTSEKKNEAAEAEVEKAKMETDEVESKRKAVQAAAEEDRKRRNIAADVAQASKDSKDGKPPWSG